MTKPHC